MKKNNLTKCNEKNGMINDMLTKPGDKLSARVTDSYRKVIKVETENGNSKYSATQYPNGTIVETKTTKKK